MIEPDAGRERRTILFIVLLALGLISAAVVSAQVPGSGTVTLSTTTSTQDSGLLDVLVPLFEKQTGYTVKTISVGTGQALALAARGEADVTLCHAPALEKKYVAEGKMLDRRLVMYNDFLVVGPEADPAKIKGERSVVAAMKKIAAAGGRFVSRGDKSGTHILEQTLWKQADVTPAAPWYIESGQGMGATLRIASDWQMYTLTDRATLLASSKRVDLETMVEGDKLLLNVYSVMEVNPANGPKVNVAGGKAFAAFMLAPETQAVIKTFGMDMYGQPLFVPIAGKKDEGLLGGGLGTDAVAGGAAGGVGGNRRRDKTMSLYEFLGILIGLISATIALTALVRGLVIAARQLELQAITAALAKRQLEALDRKERAESKADVTVDLVTVGRTDWRFVVSNRGDVPATDVNFTIAETSTDNPLVRSECERKLPFPKLESGQSFTLHAALHLRSALQYPARLTWRNPDGGSVARDVHVAL